MAYSDVYRKELEARIRELREKENAIRHAFKDNSDMLFIQLGGPTHAENLRKSWKEEREFLEEVYFLIYGNDYHYRVFNEL